MGAHTAAWPSPVVSKLLFAQLGSAGPAKPAPRGMPACLLQLETFPQCKCFSMPVLRPLLHHIFLEKGWQWGSVGSARKVRVTPSPDMAPSCWRLLLPCRLKPRAPHAGLLPRRFWYRRPVSCRVSPAEAEDIAEERGQRWSLLSLVLPKNPANEEKGWTLHQAQTFPSSISVCRRDR